MIDRIVLVVSVVVVFVAMQAGWWGRLFFVKRPPDPPKPARPQIRITYQYEKKRTDEVPRYEAGTDVAGAVQFSAHTQSGRS